MTIEKHEPTFVSEKDIFKVQFSVLSRQFHGMRQWFSNSEFNFNLKMTILTGYACQQFPKSSWTKYINFKRCSPSERVKNSLIFDWINFRSFCRFLPNPRKFILAKRLFCLGSQKLFLAKFVKKFWEIKLSLRRILEVISWKDNISLYNIFDGTMKHLYQRKTCIKLTKLLSN